MAESYPYLFKKRALYAPYGSYKEAVAALRNASPSEIEKFVKATWPHAHIYEHGPDWTVLPLDWRDRQSIKDRHPELEIPATLSKTMTFKRKMTAEETSKVEAFMWRIAAFTLVERDFSVELAEREQEKA